MLSFPAIANLNHAQIFIFDKEVDKIINEQKVPGAAIAIVSDEKIIFKKFIGDTENKQKIAGDTIFQLASLSKGFLGSLLSIMVENKQFNWDKIVTKELKDFKLKNSDYTQRLTFHDIASMQTGLPEFAGKEFLMDATSRQEIITNIAKVDSLFAPGEKSFSYQYSILAVFEELIKKKTGIEWEKFLQKKILDPLKLVNTGTDIHSLSNKNNLAQAYNDTNQPIDWSKFKVNSAAGIYSSLNDLTKWLQLHIKGGNIGNKQLISQAEINKMRLSYTPINDYNGYLIQNPFIEALSYGRFWKNYLYNTKNQKLKVIEHNGNCEGAANIISFIPDKKIGIIVLTNKFTSSAELIRNEFLKILTE
jgi:CubicO group peptidase (beta-lactamase class C family)